MNMSNILTVANDFPIQYPGQAPTDDMFAARAFLEVVHGAIERACSDKRGLSQQEARNMLHLLGEIENRLDALQRLLDDHELPSLEKFYQRARREQILDQQRAAK